MNFYKVNDSILKITLTDAEVISCFGAYERLGSFSHSVQLSVNRLLGDVIRQNRDFFNSGSISAGIRAIKNHGCEITLYRRRALRKAVQKEYQFIFAGSEDMTNAILTLFSRKQSRNLESSLYKIYGYYCLTVKCCDPDRIFIINEYCIKKHSDRVFGEYIKEHGTPLIINDAISRYGMAFKEIL